MKKTIITLTLLAGITLNLFAQREIPMFFDKELGLQTYEWSTRRVSYSPDGSRIAATYNNNKISIWDAATGKEITRMTGHSEPITGIKFSPNGKQLVSISGQDTSIKIWDAISGQLIRSITQSRVLDISFSPDGNRIAGSVGNDVKIWNIANGSEIQNLTGHSNSIRSVIYSSDGKQILTASQDQSVRIWDTGNGKIIRVINDETGFFRNAIFSPNGRFITAYSYNNGNKLYFIRIYNAGTGQEIISISAQLSAPYDLAYSPDGKQLLVNTWINDGNTKIIKVFDPDTGRELRSFNCGDFAFAYSPDGRRILTDSKTFELKIGNKEYGASYASILDATTGRTIGTIGYGPLNVGAKAFADLQIARFLNNTAEVSKNEAVLKFITDKGYATRQEIEAFYRDNVRALIAAVVDEEFNKISFMIDRNYNAVLTRNPQNGQYKLSYEGVRYVVKEISATSLEAISSAMSKSGDFSATAFNEVKAQAALIPAVVYADWKARGVANGVDGMALIKEALTNFYLNPSKATYEAILGIRARYEYINDAFTFVAIWSLRNTLSSLNPELEAKAQHDILAASRLGYTDVPNDPRFNIFSTRYR